MTKLRYHDFILFTEQAKFESAKVLTYNVYVFESPAGEGEKTETVKINDYHALDRKRRQLEKRVLNSEEQIEFGIQLAKFLLPPYAQDFFTRSLAELGPDEGLRLRLRLVDELAQIPWEFMCLEKDTKKPGVTDFIGLDPRISIVRHEAMAISPQRSISSNERQIFIAMASPKPYEKYKLLKSLPEEQRLITQAIRDFDTSRTKISCLPEYRSIDDLSLKTGASLDHIRQEMMKFDHVDIFHFSGHGEFSEEMSATLGRFKGTGSIILADDENNGVPIPGENLATLLREKGIRLVILGACETGMTDIFNAWTSVTASLLKNRIPSVIAMQFTIFDQYAAEFMAALYEALADGRTIDEAVFQGRIAIWAKAAGSGQDVRDWGTPVLYSRVHQEHVFPPIQDDALRSRAQQSIENRSRVYQTWWQWMDQGATVSKSQLKYIAEYVDLDELSPMQLLILLRSAVAEEVPVEPWLTLAREKCVELIKQLDDNKPDGSDHELIERSVLNLDDISPKLQPASVGQVAWIAVAHPSQDSLVSQTAALSLTLLPIVPEEGLKRIDNALKKVTSVWERFKRKIELRGYLADRDPQINQFNSNLPPWERIGIWYMRVKRRMQKDKDRIRKMVYGVALGAGLSLGTLHGILGFIAGPSARVRFGINLFYGGILGAAVGLGLALADSLDLKTSPFSWEQKPSKKASTNILALIMSTIFFAIAHIIVAWFNNLRLDERPIIVWTGTLTGLGLTIALYGLPHHKKIKLVNWVLRLVPASILAILAQWVIISMGEDWAASSVTRTGAHVQNIFGSFLKIYSFIGQHLNTVSYAFSALVNGVMAIGIYAGMRAQGVFKKGDNDES